MSIDTTDYVWRARTGLRASEKLVLLRIADRVNRQNGVAWPSVQSLAHDCGLSKTGTLQILNRLIAGGYVDVVREHVGRRPRTYRVNLDRLACGQPGSPRDSHACGQPGSPLDTPTTAVVCGQRGALVVNASESCGQPGGPKPEEPELEPEANTEAPGHVPFKVYAAIAREAIDTSVLDDRSEDFGNYAEWFKRRCAQQGLPYDADITRRAVDAAWLAREKEKQHAADHAHGRHRLFPSR
jgi:hypothetical protein